MAELSDSIVASIATETLKVLIIPALSRISTRNALNIDTGNPRTFVDNNNPMNNTSVYIITNIQEDFNPESYQLTLFKTTHNIALTQWWLI